MIQQVRNRLTRLGSTRGEWVLGLSALAVIVLALMTLSPAATQASRWVFDRIPVLGGVGSQLNPFRTRHALYQTGLPVYDLSIKPAEYRRLMAVVDEARRRGQLSDDLKQWSEAKFIHNGVSHDARVRVHGDLSTHWEGRRISLRVRLDKDQPLNGVRDFRLIVLRDNKGIDEPFTNAVFRRLGLMTLRDGHAIVRINGALQGVYYHVEHFDAPLLARHGRPESTLFANPRYGVELGSFKAQVTRDDPLAWQALQTLLDYETDPTDANLAAALAVTDVEDYLRFIAGTTLFCSDHSTFLSDNHRLYYDTARGQFRRVPWDIRPLELPKLYLPGIEDLDAAIDVFRFEPMSRLRQYLVTDPAYRLRRDRILWDLVKDDGLLTLFDETYEQLEPALWADAMGDGDEVDRLAAFRSTLTHNIRLIRRALSHSQVELRIRDEAERLASVQVAVNSAAGAQIDELRLSLGESFRAVRLYRDTNDSGALDAEDVPLGSATTDREGMATIAGLAEVLLPDMRIRWDYPTYFFRKPVRTVVHAVTRRYNFLLAWEGAAEESTPLPVVEVVAINAVTDAPISPQDLHVQSYQRGRSFDPARRNRSVDEFLAGNPSFVRAESLEKEVTITLPAGEHEFDRTVVVPSGITLRIEPGATLLLGQGASLVCFGPVLAEGTATDPIRIRSAGDGAWGTFAAVRPGGPSVLRYVYVSGGSGAEVDGIRFTGAVAFHDGDITVEQCRFVDSQAEDALNVKDSAVTIRDSYFSGMRSDAVDLDFTHGVVERSHFLAPGGDAIDFSGSQVTVSGCRIEGAGDKGISVGERSTVRIVDSFLRGNEIGVAVKDLSKADIEQCTFIDHPQAVMAYRKKPIFGGGEVTMRACIVVASDRPVVTDDLSSVAILDSVVPAGVEGTDCTFASSDLPQLLGGQGFVYNHYDRNAAPEQAADLTGPGIRRPPIDLR